MRAMHTCVKAISVSLDIWYIFNNFRADKIAIGEMVNKRQGILFHIIWQGGCYERMGKGSGPFIRNVCVRLCCR